MPQHYDLTCVVHVHSTHSDGTGTVPEIAAAAARNAVDVVLLTDHDTLAARRLGEEGWHGSVLVLVGEEVSPRGRDHYLAFGVQREVKRGQPSAGICAAVKEQGGFGFAAHPWSAGSQVYKRPGAMPWTDIDCDGLEGIEVWSFVTDTLESLRSVGEILRFVARPERVVDHAPELNVAEWDRLGARRRVVGIAGLDAHQIGIRVLGRVPIRAMSYARSFGHLHTHVLCDELPTGELEHDSDQVYSALRSGRCYMAVDSIAPARGFEFGTDSIPMGAEIPAGPITLRTRTPRPAALRLLRDGTEIARTSGATLEHQVEEPGVYRVEARLEAHGRERTWILSNPIYLR
jgi:methylmalonyl-CoA mutase cobalamin-binding subunit